MKKVFFLLFIFLSLVYAQGDGYALTFDSNKNDFGCLYFTDWNFDASSAMTVSVWMRWSRDPAPTIELQNKWANIISNNSYSSSDDGQFWMQHNSTNSSFEFAVKTVNGRNYVTSHTRPQKDVWYHLCGVYNDDDPDYSLKLYVNGVLDAYSNNPSGLIYPFYTAYITKLGRWSRPTYPRNFDGSVDEVTIWNRALTQAEIQTLITNQLPDNNEGLQGYWKFNDASGDRFSDETGSRDGIIFSTYNGYGQASGGSSTTLVDDSDIWGDRDFAGHPIHIISGSGALQGGMIASNTTTTITLENQWDHYSHDPDNTSYYAISCSSKWNRYVKDNLQTAMGPVGRQIKATITSTPDDENHLLLYMHGWLPSDLEDDESIPNGFARRADFCWGIDDIGTVSEDLVFDYNSVSGISDPAQIELLVRDNRDDLSWVEVTEFSRNDGARTITLSGVSVAGEYVLGSKNSDDFPLAVTLIDFKAEDYNGGVRLSWTTETEVENLGFILERLDEDGYSVVLGDYLTCDELYGQWNSTVTTGYEFIDATAEPGKLYHYRLCDVGCCSGVTLCAELEYSPSSEPDADLFDAVPNPFNPQTVIEFLLQKEEYVEINIYDLYGKKVNTVFKGICSAGRQSLIWKAHDIPSGIYIYSLEIEQKRIMKKCLFLK